MMMNSTFHYCISARWGLRLETAQSLAARLRHLIAKFRMIDPILGHWYDWRSETQVAPLDLAPEALTRKVAESIVRKEDGTPSKSGGYYFSTVNNDRNSRGPRDFVLVINGGSDARRNFATLDTEFGVVPDPDVVTYAIFKAAVLAMSECFEAVYCDAFPSDLHALWVDGGRKTPALRLAWISYVSPRFAPLVTPPPSAIVERQSNGGLLMAAADETFVTSNPQHLAAARDILAAAAPLNANPWPGQQR
jgi:hypothetical protein